MIEELINKLETYENLDAIVVEGYDGVGKGRILNSISEHYGVIPYRPDYNMWQEYDLRKQDRWKISGFFWDIYSHFNHHGDRKVPMLFDRGVMSGAVYNDYSVVFHYRDMLRDMKVLHVLVLCSYEDYIKFYKARNPEATILKMNEDWSKCYDYTETYIHAFEAAEVPYIVYENVYDDSINNDLCRSCGHYSYGICRHPNFNCEVDGDKPRCSHSTDVEVQDIVEQVPSM